MPSGINISPTLTNFSPNLRSIIFCFEAHCESIDFYAKKVKSLGLSYAVNKDEQCCYEEEIVNFYQQIIKSFAKIFSTS